MECVCVVVGGGVLCLGCVLSAWSGLMAALLPLCEGKRGLWQMPTQARSHFMGEFLMNSFLV